MLPLNCLSFNLRLLIYYFGILWPLCCLSFNLRLLSEAVNWRTDNTMATRFQSSNQKPYIEGQLLLWYLVAIVLSVLQFTASDLLLWYLVAIVLSAVNWRTVNTMVTRYQSSKSEAVNWRTDNTLATRYQSSNQKRLLITTLVSCGHGIVCPSIYGFWLLLWYLVAIVFSVLQFTASDYYFGVLAVNWRTDNTMATWHQSSNQKP
jgi:hypothetical protein